MRPDWTRRISAYFGQRRREVIAVLFWTVRDEKVGEQTLCEKCGLRAFRLATHEHPLLADVRDLAEGFLLMSAYAAMLGAAEAVIDCTASGSGVCGECNAAVAA